MVSLDSKAASLTLAIAMMVLGFVASGCCGPEAQKKANEFKALDKIHVVCGDLTSTQNNECKCKELQKRWDIVIEIKEMGCSMDAKSDAENAKDMKRDNKDWGCDTFATMELDVMGNDPNSCKRARTIENGACFSFGVLVIAVSVLVQQKLKVHKARCSNHASGTPLSTVQ